MLWPWNDVEEKRFVGRCFEGLCSEDIPVDTLYSLLSSEKPDVVFFIAMYCRDGENVLSLIQEPLRLKEKALGSFVTYACTEPRGKRLFLAMQGLGLLRMFPNVQYKVPGHLEGYLWLRGNGVSGFLQDSNSLLYSALSINRIDLARYLMEHNTKVNPYCSTSFL